MMIYYTSIGVIQRVFLLFIINFVLIATNNATKVHIPIVYACDDKYVMPTIVSMESAMRSKKDTSFYEFTILVPSEFKCEEKFNIFQNKYKRKCTVNIVDMKDAYSDCSTGKWGKCMYYRLSIPYILKDADKAIYLDGDTLVRGDLQEMLNLNLDDNMCGGVPDPVKYNDYKNFMWLNSKCNIYINSGVLLINCKAWREESGIRDTIRRYSKNIENYGFTHPDQDIINVVFGGKIQLLPCKFMRFNLFSDIEKEYNKCEYARLFYNEEQFLEGRNNPVIVHYLGKEKPWRTNEGVPKKLYDEWRNIFNTIKVRYKFKDLESKSRCCCNCCSGK